MISVFLFVLGAILGSFANVLIYRIPLGISILGRSKCPKCKETITWKDNVPLVSFFVLGGRCRHCRVKISWRYPFVEGLCGVLFVLGWHFLYSTPLLIFYLLAVPILISIFFIDLKSMIIPDSLNFVLMLFSFVYLLAESTFYKNVFFGFVISCFLLFLFFVTKKRGMGLGDVKMVLPMGAVLGFPKAIYFLWGSFVLGAIVGIFLLIVGRKKLKSKIPFGPFLLISFLSTLLLYG